MTGASNLSNKSHLLTAISAAGGGMQVGQLKDGAFNCQFCGALLPRLGSAESEADVFAETSSQFRNHKQSWLQAAGRGRACL